jgi:hypothetical protein
LALLAGCDAKPDLALGDKLYVQHCASCHGANLEGQPDWRKRLPNGRFPAPPHDATGHTWHHPDEVLFAVTKHVSGAAVRAGALARATCRRSAAA